MNKHDTIQVQVVHSVYKTRIVYQRLEDGELYHEKKEIVAKQIKVKKWFRKECISSVEQYVTSKNKIAKNRSVIFDKFSGRFYATFHSPEDILYNISSSSTSKPIGYSYDSNIHPSVSQVQQYKPR